MLGAEGRDSRVEAVLEAVRGGRIIELVFDDDDAEPPAVNNPRLSRSEVGGLWVERSAECDRGVWHSRRHTPNAAPGRDLGLGGCTCLAA